MKKYPYFVVFFLLPKIQIMFLLIYDICGFIPNRRCGISYKNPQPTILSAGRFPVSAMVPMATSAWRKNSSPFSNFTLARGRIWGVPEVEDPPNGWFLMENPIKKMDDDWGYPYFRKPSFRKCGKLCFCKTKELRGPRIRSGENVKTQTHT